MKDSNQYDLDGIFHGSPDEDEARVVDAYSELWAAMAAIKDEKGRDVFPKDWIIRSEVPVGFIQPPDWATIGDMPKCTDEHIEIGCQFMRRVMASMLRRHSSLKKAGEKSCLNRLRYHKVFDVIAPHFGYLCSNWDQPYINEDLGVFWVEESNGPLKEREFPDALFQFVLLPEATDDRIVMRLNALRIMNTREDFIRKAIEQRYIHTLQYADVRGRLRSRTAMSVARNTAAWPDIEQAFICAVCDQQIESSWDGTKVETMLDVIALKERYDMPLTKDEAAYAESKKLDEATRRRIARERVSARSSYY